MITLLLASPSQTRALARILADVLRPPVLVTIAGDLGTGKTTLVREVLRARGVRGVVTSPSFTLAQSYHGAGGEELHHLDLYRLEPGSDVELFAWDDYLGQNALTFVEWPAAGSAALPAPALQIELEHRTIKSRTARIVARPPVEATILARALAAGLRDMGDGQTT